MEQDRSLIDEIEDGAPIGEEAAQNVRHCAPAGCLTCALEEWDDEWEGE